MKTRAFVSLLLAVMLTIGCIEITLVEREPGEQVVKFELVTHTPSGQASAALTPTSNDASTLTFSLTATKGNTATSTQSPSRTLPPTRSQTPTQTASETPSPTSTPTQTQTPTPTRMRTPTNTPSATPQEPEILPAPIALEPKATRFADERFQIEFSWDYKGQLPSGYEFVVLLRASGGQEYQRPCAAERTDIWRCWIYPPPPGDPGQYEWWLEITREGRRIGVTSNVLRFSWIEHPISPLAMP